MGLRDSISDYFNRHPRAKKALGVATAIAANFTMLVTGSTVLAAAAGTIIDHKQNQEKIQHDQLMDFFKQAIQEPEVQQSIRTAVVEGGAEIASHVSTAMNQLGMHSPESAQFVSTMKSDLTVIAKELGIIREMISYYEIPDSKNRVTNVWRLPHYLDEVMVIDKDREAVVASAIKYVQNDSNVVILGSPGSGKTTILYAIWKYLCDERDTALVWDTKDVSKVHERYGAVLFCDDLPETRELARAVAEKDVRGVVTTAREQEWSRLPLEVRERFRSITLPNLSNDVMKEIASNHLKSQSVEYDDEALDAIVENAQGSPIYVRYVTEEIGADYRTGRLTKLIRRRAMRAPKGMSDYVAGILARILFDLDGTVFTPKEGALPVIKTLLCLADMPNYETHEVHLNQMFFTCKQPSDGPGPFNAFKQYLSRDPRFYSLKFMHDTLADVLRGSVDHPIVGDIRMVAQEMGASGRRRISLDALKDGWKHIKEEYEFDRSGGLDSLLSYGYFSAKNFGIDHIDNQVIELANQHVENPISQGIFAVLGPITEIPSKELPQEVSDGPSLEASETGVTTSDSPPVPKLASLGSIGQMIKERMGGLFPEEARKEIEGQLAELGNIPELSKLSGKSPSELGDAISELVEQRIGKIGLKKEESSLDKLEAVLEDNDSRPKKLARLLKSVSKRTKILAKHKKVKEPERTRSALHRGAIRLAESDPILFVKVIQSLSQALLSITDVDETVLVLGEIIDGIPQDELSKKERERMDQIMKSLSGPD